MFTVGAMYRYLPTGAICRVDKNDGEHQRVRVTVVDPASSQNGREIDDIPYHQLQDLPSLNPVEIPIQVQEEPSFDAADRPRNVRRIRGEEAP